MNHETITNKAMLSQPMAGKTQRAGRKPEAVRSSMMLLWLMVRKSSTRNKEDITMNEKDFVALVKKTVAEYANEHLDKTDKKQITEEDVFIVWMCKTLQNSKAMVSTTLFDGMYYELTYNGDKKELYLDAYKKWENKCIPVT